METKNVRTRGKRPMRNLSLADKVRAIQRIHDGETKAAVSRDLGVPESTLRGWCKNEQKLRTMSSQSLILDGFPTADKVRDKSAQQAVSAETKQLGTNLLKMPNLKLENNASETYENNDFMPQKFPLESFKDYEHAVNALGYYNWGSHFMAQDDLLATEFIPSEQTVKTEVMENVNNFNYAKTEISENLANDIHKIPLLSDSLKIELSSFNQSEQQNSSHMPEEDFNNNNNNNYNSSSNNDNNYTYMQWCSMLIGSINFMAQACVAADIIDTSSSSAGQESKSVISSQYANKRTYDDPFSELRNIYELNKSSDGDESIDDSIMSCDELPQDLSIKMR